MIKLTRGNLKEIGYDIADSAKLGSVFGIGNGYFGVRGSLEELGEVFIQGTYIRGYFDRIVEIPLTFSDNLYMKRYYFDDEKLKEFEHEDSCINVCDPLTARFYVNGKLFLPWEGKVLRWDRHIDYKTGGLIRTVVWDDGEGHKTAFRFARHCSFADNHLILQSISVKKLNHDLPVEALLGIDTVVKTNGQHKSVVTSSSVQSGRVELSFYAGDKYNMESSLCCTVNACGAKETSVGEEKGIYGCRYCIEGGEASFTKVTSVYASIDPVPDFCSACKDVPNYGEAYKAHVKAYRKAFSKIDIKIEGDAKADALLRYANYQTLIGFDRFDSVHSLSAKNLTAEKYNQFVWWDAEIFQLPAVLSTFPDAAKACLEYRYRCFEEAKKNAAKEFRRGARFAFCSSVKGDENVWIYAKHPFLQIHITSDVAYGVYNYYRQTLDRAFLLEKGLPMMVGAMLYFRDRATLRDGALHLDNVTGTDEHHDYVNDDAYTNYEVSFLAKKTLSLASELGYALTEEERSAIEDLEGLSLPKPNAKGVIPQFEGYLSLKPYLPLSGNGAGTGFQMKASGLYHLSQIIKQPDVLNLFANLDVGMDPSLYRANYRYYTKMCEASSSLTYPTHAIASIDNRDNQAFLSNFFACLEIDIKDINHCAYQGVHAGCLAGGWNAIYRGVFGIHPEEGRLVLNPDFASPFEKVSMPFVYHGEEYRVTLDRDTCTLTSKKATNIPVLACGVEIVHGRKTVLKKGISHE